MTAAGLVPPADAPRGATRPRRLALIAYSTAEFDSRTYRIARSALRAGYEVTVYARWAPGLPRDSTENGYRVVRVPSRPRLVLPFLTRSRASRAVPGPATKSVERGGSGPATDASAGEAIALRAAVSAPDVARRPSVRARRSFPRRVVARLLRAPRRAATPWLKFPREIIPWGVDLDAVVQPADVWHARLIGGLPAAVRQQRRLGGAAVYDSGDVYVQSRDLARGRAYPRVLGYVERRWASRCAAVITVNEPYADLLEHQLRVGRPVVVMNCSERFTVPDPPPDLIRRRLGVDPGTAVVLYQGGLLTERGIEEGMDAILQVPRAVLVLMGHGGHRERYVARAAAPPYRGRVHVIDAVPPGDLLRWTASADVMLIAIQPTTPNQRYSTPNKLFEALAAGVPVVASDLPGMSGIVRETNCGELCDPTSPPAIARAIRALLDASPEERRQARQRCLDAARQTYNWESQQGRLLETYDRVVAAAAT